MTPLTPRQQITHLCRERANLLAQIFVHALADEDPAAIALYEQVKAMDSEIEWLTQMRIDRLQEHYLERQGAAAVAWVERFLAVERWRQERDSRAAVRWVEAYLGCEETR